MTYSVKSFRVKKIYVTNNSHCFSYQLIGNNVSRNNIFKYQLLGSVEEQEFFFELTNYYSHELEQLVKVFGRRETQKSITRLVQEGMLNPATSLKIILIELMSVHPRLEENWDYGEPCLMVRD
jgi:hypothetical protein